MSSFDAMIHYNPDPVRQPEERRFGPVWFIPGPNRGKYPFCHSIYIETGGILIDPSADRDRLAAIRDEYGVREVWLSHAHEDHLLHMDLFDGVPLFVAEADVAPLKDPEILIDAYGVEDIHREEWRRFLNDVVRFKPLTPTGVLRGGDTRRFENLSIDIIETPGHTPGHLAFYFREPDVLFLGDYDLSGFGPWYGDVASDIDQTIASVRRLRSLNAGIKLTSHETGCFESEPEDIWDRYLEVIDRRERRLLELLKTPKTIEEIVASHIVYGRSREPAAFFDFGEKALMGKHLERLMQSGRVEEKEGSYVVV